MKLDPQASRVTSVFMVLALIAMAALAWSVSRDHDEPAAPLPINKHAAPTEADAAS